VLARIRTSDGDDDGVDRKQPGFVGRGGEHHDRDAADVNVANRRCTPFWIERRRCPGS
jgi:hypothetical protein